MLSCVSSLPLKLSVLSQPFVLIKQVTLPTVYSEHLTWYLGTLTEGKMKAEIIWVDGESYSFTGSGDKPDDGHAVTQDGKDVPTDPAAVPARLKSGLLVSALCNNATISKADGANVSFDCL